MNYMKFLSILKPPLELIFEEIKQSINEILIPKMIQPTISTILNLLLKNI